MNFPSFVPYDRDMRIRFDHARRAEQLEHCGHDMFVVRSVKGAELRRYLPVVALKDDDVAGAVNNFTEFQRGNAVCVLMDANGKIGLVEAYRPIVPPERMQEYTGLWDEYAGNLDAFIARVASILGVPSLECPQGYSDAFEESAKTAEREGGEEGGCRILSVEHIGHACTDPANRADPVHVYLAQVDPSKPARHERDPLEANTGRVQTWASEREFLDLVSNGKVLNALTLSAAMLLRANGYWR